MKVSVSAFALVLKRRPWNEANGRRCQPPAHEAGVQFNGNDQTLICEQIKQAREKLKIVVSPELRAQHALLVDQPSDARIVARAKEGLFLTKAHSILARCTQEERRSSTWILLGINRPRSAQQRTRFLCDTIEDSQIEGLGIDGQPFKHCA